MPCISSLLKLSHPCQPQMGGIKNVYLRGSASLEIALGSQGTGPLVFAPDYDLYGGYEQTFGTWRLDFPSADEQFEELTVPQIIEELTGTVGIYKFLHVATQRTGATIESTLQTSDSGAQYYRNVVTLPLAGLTGQAAQLLYQMQHADLQVLVETWGGKWLVLGTEEPAKLTGNTGTTGGTYGDMPGNTVQITYESRFPLPVNPAMGWGSDPDNLRDFSPATIIGILKGIGLIVD